MTNWRTCVQHHQVNIRLNCFGVNFHALPSATRLLLVVVDDVGRVSHDSPLSHTCIYGVQAWGFAAWVWPLWANSRCLHPTWLLYTSIKRICIHSISFENFFMVIFAHANPLKFFFQRRRQMICDFFFFFFPIWIWISNTYISLLLLQKM